MKEDFERAEAISDRLSEDQIRLKIDQLSQKMRNIDVEFEQNQASHVKMMMSLEEQIRVSKFQNAKAKAAAAAAEAAAPTVRHPLSPGSEDVPRESDNTTDPVSDMDRQLAAIQSRRAERDQLQKDDEEYYIRTKAAHDKQMKFWEDKHLAFLQSVDLPVLPIPAQDASQDAPQEVPRGSQYGLRPRPLPSPNRLEYNVFGGT